MATQALDDAIRIRKEAGKVYGIDWELFKAHTDPIPNVSTAELASLHIRSLQIMREFNNEIIKSKYRDMEAREELYENQISTLRAEVEFLRGLVTK